MNNLHRVHEPRVAAAIRHGMPQISAIRYDGMQCREDQKVLKPWIFMLRGGNGEVTKYAGCLLRTFLFFSLDSLQDVFYNQ